MFNNFNLENKEVIKILNDYNNLIKINSKIKGIINEDLEQEIKLRIFEVLTKNRKKS